MATIHTATAFLKAHGNVNHVAHTEDGIIATAWETTGTARLEVMEGLRDEDDMWFEATAVFPVVNNTVDLSAIRAWLGY